METTLDFNSHISNMDANNHDLINLDMILVDKEPKFTVPSYRIQVQVQDETNSTTFILFDKGAEKFISMTAKELAKTQEENLKLDENVLPMKIQRIIGNEYFFQLHLDEYNLKYGRGNYIVSKILETEISYKVEGHQVIIKLKSISNILITFKYHRIHNYS
ncbi:hypothetical protein CMV_003161 [Castanea mollissima]|uniref:Replication factor A C-terminal domain-containing protein n=1 Tax=Castanea mollissima TaxID=60419 RepID=A0A8J4RSJ1_9ROSI|nr:hypothetical protein CMV_003161 [Castanea mollissima]